MNSAGGQKFQLFLNALGWHDLDIGRFEHVA
jgi:hypothetical protein